MTAAERSVQAIATGFLVSALVCKLLHLLNQIGNSHSGFSILGIHQGLGLHYEMLDPDIFLTHFFKCLFVGEILYLTVICLVKYSILAFYWRLFGKSIRVPVQILAGVTTLWGLAVVRDPSITSDVRVLTDDMTSYSSPYSSARQLKDFGTGR